MTAATFIRPNRAQRDAQESKAVAAHRRSKIEWARHDATAFIEYVIKNEVSGDLVKIQPFQQEWLDLLDQHERLILWSAADLGKSWIVTIGRMLWELGRNPNLRIVIVSAKGGTKGTGGKIVSAIKQIIERSTALHEVFPHLLPGHPWTGDAFSVQRTGDPKDFSIQAIGVGTKILGAKIDRLICDDLLDLENTSTDHQRKKTIGWMESDLVTRFHELTRIAMLGNVYHRDDAMHAFAKRPGYVSRVYPILGDERIAHLCAEGTSIWPSYWTPKKTEQARIDAGPVEFLRKYLCKVRVDGDSHFKEAWIRNALARGEGRSLAYALQALPNGCSTHTGVDLGVSDKPKADLTCGCTILVHPNGDRELLGLESGRWGGPIIVAKVIQWHQRYQSIVRVESNAAQAFIVQFVKGESAVPVRAHYTGKDKVDPVFGIEGLATEFANGKWIIPNKGGRMHPEVAALINEMLVYDPRSHSGDRLMSLWLAREDARKGPQAEAAIMKHNLRRR